MKRLIPRILAWMCLGLCVSLLIIAAWTASHWALAGRLGATAGVIAVLAFIFAMVADP